MKNALVWAWHNLAVITGVAYIVTSFVTSWCKSLLTEEFRKNHPVATPRIEALAKFTSDFLGGLRKLEEAKQAKVRLSMTPPPNKE